MKTKGKKALLERLRKELAANYRPYVAAWLANYQLYGDLLGAPEAHDEPAGWLLANQAMKEGSIFAKEIVGRAMVDGRGIPKRQPAAAAVLLREAVETGRYTAMSQLATLYYFGSGVPKDLKQAETWARRAAYRGTPEELFLFGQWMESGKAGRPPDLNQACHYYREAAAWGSSNARKRLQALEKEGIAEARICLAMLLLYDLSTGSDFTTVRIKRAVQSLEAERPDDPRVLVAVGQIRMERKLPVFDETRAWAELEKAAQLGDTNGRYFQAEMLRRGIGRKKDIATALAQIQTLANGGNAYALGRLGWLYYWGSDLPEKDETKAFFYTRAAAHAGDMWSVLNLGFLHEHGVGTPVNYYLSARYYSIAEDVGFREATRRKNAALAFIKD